MSTRPMAMDLFEKLKKIRILLIDDDRWVRESMAMFFEGEGYIVSVCETAEEGLEEVSKGDFHILISDYLLPGMDGLEFFRRIPESYKGTPKLLITAYGSEKVFSEAEGLGLDAVIEKPITIEILKQCLFRLLRQENRKEIVQMKGQSKAGRRSPRHRPQKQ